MAKFNRAFLVPYLQNVCALHLAYNKLEKRICELWDEDIPYLKRGKPNPKPVKPEKPDRFSTGGIASLLFGSIFLLMTLTAFFSEKDVNLGDFLILLFGVFLCILMIWIPIHSIKYRKRKYDYELYQYQQAMEEYEKKAAYNKKLKDLIPAYEENFEFYKRERDNIDILLDQVYDTNIIPSRYRNIYAAVYLYDWFSTSRADDLDMALNMFVLEEIKEKLDIIIDRQSEAILNQRLMLANQQRSYEQQQRHSAMMRSKLNQITASNEERNIYLSMIESNTAATAYFAAADYIRKI